jgi:hypothetical protein
MKAVRASQIVCLALLLCVGGALGQTTTNALAATNSPLPAIENEGAKWAFSVWAYGYLVPGGGDYVQPTITADRDGLHMEARYNDEALHRFPPDHREPSGNRLWH